MKLSALRNNTITILEGRLIAESVLGKGEAIVILRNMISGMLPSTNEGVRDFYLFMHQIENWKKKRNTMVIRPGQVPDKLKAPGRKPMFIDALAVWISQIPFEGENYTTQALPFAFAIKEGMKNTRPDLHNKLKWDAVIPTSFNILAQNNRVYNLAGEALIHGNMGSPFTTSRKAKGYLEKAGFRSLEAGGSLATAIMQMLELGQVMWYAYKCIKHGKSITHLDGFFKKFIKFKVDNNIVAELRNQFQQDGDTDWVDNMPDPTPEQIKKVNEINTVKEPQKSEPPEKPESPAEPEPSVSWGPTPQEGDVESPPGKVTVPDDIPDPEDLTPEQQAKLDKLLGK